MSTGGLEEVYRVVRLIPHGRVATYGDVAVWAGRPGSTRQVNWALHTIESSDDVPWHRVINARGEVSPQSAREDEGLQRALLEAEGVCFAPSGRVDLGEKRWRPVEAGPSHRQGTF